MLNDIYGECNVYALYGECHNTECSYTESRFAERHWGVLLHFLSVQYITNDGTSCPDTKTPHVMVD
jgi:hypothetical protein